MKHTLKRALALLIALLLALPTFAFADEPADGIVDLEAAEEEQLIVSDEVDLPVGEMGEILLGDEEPDDATDPQKPSPSVEGVSADALTDEVASADASDPREPSLSGEGVSADALTDEVASADASDPQEPSPSVEGVSADALTDEVASTDATAPQEPSPSGEGVSADALTEEVVPALLAADGDGDTAGNPPPSGSIAPRFYIASACTEHGDVSSSPNVKVSEKPLDASYSTQVSSQLTLFATPHQGYVFKGWEIVSVNPNGEPFLGYSLVGTQLTASQYELNFGTFNNIYVFRITAIFEQEAQPITVQVDNLDKNGTLNTGSKFTASAATVYAGDTVTLTLNMVEGAQFAEPENGAAYPQITYTSVNENTVGDHDFTITPEQSGNTWTFTVPDDIAPQYPTIRVLSSFTDILYGISVSGEYEAIYGTIEDVDKQTAPKGDTVTVKVSVTKSASFDTETGLTVLYTDGDETKTVPVTLTETTGGGEGASFTDYTYTFTMPAHAVTVSAEITPKGYAITLPTISSGKYMQSLWVNTVLMTDHIALRAEEGDTVEFKAWYDFTAGETQGDDTTTQGVKRLYYTIGDDPTEHDIPITETTATMGGKGSFAMPAGNVTIGVQYETAYKVGVTQPEVGGEIGVSQRYAFEGDTVTVTAEPETGDATNTWFECAVTNSDGTIETAHTDPLTVTFTMPGKAVLVSGTINAAPYKVNVLEADQARLSVDRPIAAEGDTVTVTVLDDDTALNMISVYYVEGSSTKHVKFTAGTNKTGTFTMPATDVTVRVNPPVSYWANNKSNTYSGNYTVVTSDTTTWTDGWYVVNENVTINQRIEVTGNVMLLIMGVDENNYCELIANGGIHVPSGKSLTIYGGTKEEGGLRVNNVSMDNAGIGGNSGETNGAITIYSGFIDCFVKEDSNGAGIGGGKNGNGTNITINSGIVISVGTGYGAGIGGGLGGDGSNITINGGSVVAHSYYGAGIGGGDGGKGYRLQFHGGVVYAKSYKGAGIGGGAHAIGYGITVTGGSVTATSYDGAGVGAGKNVPGGNWTIFDDLIKVTGGRLMASHTYAHGYGRALIYGEENHAFPVGHLNYAVSVYEGAKISGGSSESNMQVKGMEDAIDDYCVLIEPCTHENPTYQITADTHKMQCSDCRTAFTAEPHTYDANGLCTVCGYDSHSSYVLFDSAGGSNVEAQQIANGEKATRPADPTWEGHTFQNWYRVTNAATGEHETDPFDFENTSITQSITLIAVWNHEHDGVTFQSWNSDSSLPTSAGSYFLTKDVTLTSVWAWNSGTLNLCLAGHTVTGNINNSSDALITVNGGTLNLFDEEDGTVTLVNARAATVAVETGGTFNLHGGTITSETNDSSLQGVDVAGTFHMSGGRITGNPTGVRVKRGGAFTVSGSARVTGNTVNVDLTLGNGKIQIGGALSDDARIGVTAYAGVVTSGLNGNGGLENFFSDDPSYAVFLSSDGEVRLGTPVTVTFDSDGGTAVAAQTVNSGETATRPEDPTKDGYTFAGWFQVTDATTTPATLADTAFDFDTAITGDITLKAVWEEATAEGEAVLIGSTASFSGNILLNFYITFSDALLEEKGAFVRLTFKGKNHDLPIADAGYNATYEAYRFSLPLVAKEIQDEVVVSVHHAGGEVATFGSEGNSNYTEEGYRYSLLTYTKNRSAKSTNEDMRALAKAAQDYCTAAQIYFNYNATDLSVSSDVGAVTQAQLDDYAPVTEGELPAGVSLKGITAMFESDNSLRLYLNFDGVDASSFEYKVDGKTATLGHSDNGDYLEVANVAAKRLGDKHVFSISNGTNTLTYTASVLTYARSSVINGDDARKDLGRALYLYCQAAKAYFNYPG